ncbi:MAG: hypothetical protein K0S37_1197 [Microbacterium sp.]|jgi:hypothetical protein|nr:hypothetical protein [Microbacterium sp.]
MLKALQDAVDDLAAALSRSVVIDDPRFRLVVSSPHYGDADELRMRALVERGNSPDVVAYLHSLGIATLREPTHIDGRPELGFQSRYCVPLVGEAQALLGILFLVDAVPLTTDEIATIHAATGHLVDLLAHSWGEADRQSAEIEPYVKDLIAGVDSGHTAAAVSALRARGHLAPGRRYAALVLRPAESAGRAAASLTSTVRRAARSAVGGEAVLVAPQPEGAVALVAARSADGVRDLAGALLSQSSLRAVKSMHVGIGGTVRTPESISASYRQATVAIRVVRAGVVSSPANFDELGVYSLLASITPEGISPSWMDASLRRFMDTIPDSFSSTVEAFLDRGGDVAAAAEDLHVHRSTVYYRLGRIEEALGAPLTDGGVRLQLHLWLKMQRLVERVEN